MVLIARTRVGMDRGEWLLVECARITMYFLKNGDDSFVKGWKRGNEFRLWFTAYD